MTNQMNFYHPGQMNYILKSALYTNFHCKSFFFVLLRELHVIKSEFFDRDVGTVKRIEILPKRIISGYNNQGWTLQEVMSCYFLKWFKAVQEAEALMFARKDRLS